MPSSRRAGASVADRNPSDAFLSANSMRGHGIAASCYPRRKKAASRQLSAFQLPPLWSILTMARQLWRDRTFVEIFHAAPGRSAPDAWAGRGWRRTGDEQRHDLGLQADRARR